MHDSDYTLVEFILMRVAKRHIIRLMKDLVVELFTVINISV